MVSVKVRCKSDFDVESYLQGRTESAMQRILDTGTQKALSLKKGSKDGIKYEIKKSDKGYTGKIYTEFGYAPFLEYGTGRKAELEHIGTTYTFKKTGYYFWYAPADAVRKQYSDSDYFEFEGEMYPMNAYMNGAKYVMVFEQNPHPFMRPTAFELENEIPNIVREEFNR